MKVQASSQTISRLQHRLVATRATAEVHRRGRHFPTARNLAAAAEALQLELEQLTDGVEVPTRSCDDCGCTDEHPCGGGCHWVPTPADQNLCSRCATGSAAAERR